MFQSVVDQFLRWVVGVKLSATTKDLPGNTLVLPGIQQAIRTSFSDRTFLSRWLANYRLAPYIAAFEQVSLSHPYNPLPSRNSASIPAAFSNSDCEENPGWSNTTMANCKSHCHWRMGTASMSKSFFNPVAIKFTQADQLSVVPIG